MDDKQIGPIETPAPPGRPRRSRFLPAWVLASAAGWIAGLLLGALLFVGIVIAGWGDPEFLFESESTGRWVYGALYSLPVALAGLGAAVAQVPVLRRHFPQVEGWGRHGATAWILAGPAIAAPWGLDIESGTLPVHGLAALAAGAMVGATLWLVIRAQASGAWRWILASGAASSLGAVTLVGLVLVAGEGSVQGCTGGILLIAAGTLGAPALTGAVLDRCLRVPPSRPVSARRGVLLVSVPWLLLVLAGLTALFSQQLLERRAADRLPECIGRPECPRLVMPGADLAGVKLEGASLVDADLRGADLRGAALDGADLHGANLADADLTEAALWEANLAGAGLGRAILRGAGIGGTDLSGADLRDVDAEGANGPLVILRGADLSRARLKGAILKAADLQQANLTGADLSEADMRWVKLAGANLTGASLVWATLEAADLTGADLSGADLTHTIVTAEQLAAAKSLKGTTLPDGTLHD